MSVERLEIEVVESVTYIYRVRAHHTKGDGRKDYVAQSGRKNTRAEAETAAADFARVMQRALLNQGKGPARIAELGTLVDRTT